MQEASRHSILLDQAMMAKALEEFASDALTFLTTIRDCPVVPPDLASRIQNFKMDALSEAGLGFSGAMRAFKAEIIPGLAHTAGPRAFPWVIAGVTPAALIGALYQVLYDQINMVSGASIGPILESETIKLLLDLFKLPRESFEGIFTTGATASNLCALAVARQWWGGQQGVNIAEAGMAGIPPAEVYAASPHASIPKTMGILGMGRRIIPVPKLEEREAMDVKALETLLEKSSAAAKIVVASAATVNTGDFDNLLAIRAVCSKYNAWMHVDAAFGLFARCSHKYRSLAEGAELADSITVDGHKWLNVPYDCGMLFVRAEYKKYQVAAFSSISDYLSSAADEPMNKGIENSRALRALPVWVSLQAYGHDGYRRLIEQNCSFAEAVATVLQETGEYELSAPVRLNIVLFRGKGITTSDKNAVLIKAINDTGKIFITGTVYNGQAALRIAVCNWQTSIDQDLEAVRLALIEGMANYRAAS